MISDNALHNARLMMFPSVRLSADVSNLKLALCEQIPYNLSLSLPSNFPVSFKTVTEKSRKIELHSSEREASIRPSDVLSNRLLKCLNIFTNFGMNGLHITGFTGLIRQRKPRCQDRAPPVTVSAASLSLLPSILSVANFTTIIVH